MLPFIPTMHSAIDLPGQEDMPERESVEARVVCLMKRHGDAPTAARAAEQDPLAMVRASPKFEEIKAKLVVGQASTFLDDSQQPSSINRLPGLEPNPLIVCTG